MERLPVIYIAGPYRAKTPWRILQNIRAAQEVALAVWRLGAVALCPHANTALFDGEADDAIWLAGDHELLRRCDAIICCGQWDLSTGAVAEWQLAIDLQLPRFDWRLDRTRFDVQAWITAWRENHR